MKDIAVILRGMQLFAHNGHNLCSRVVFFQDHEFLGELYSTYEGSYDGVIERIIGTKGAESIDLIMVQAEALHLIKDEPTNSPENRIYFEKLLMMEKHLCAMIEQLIKSEPISEGTKQMLGNLCDESEVRQYKMQQRTKK